MLHTNRDELSHNHKCTLHGRACMKSMGIPKVEGGRSLCGCQRKVAEHVSSRTSLLDSSYVVDMGRQPASCNTVSCRAASHATQCSHHLCSLRHMRVHTTASYCTSFLHLLAILGRAGRTAIKTIAMSQNLFHIPSRSISPCCLRLGEQHPLPRYAMLFIQKRCALPAGAQVSRICSFVPDAAAACSGDGQGRLCIGGS